MTDDHNRAISAPPRNQTARAILYSLIALLLFDIMGLIIKHLSDHYSAAELSTYRNIAGLVPAAIALWWSKDWHARGRIIQLRQWRFALLRGVFLTFAQFSFYLSLGMLAFATASTITYANALFMTALAVPLLREKVGPVRWAAVLIGFVGIVWIVRPGSDVFTPAALLPLAAAALYALVSVTARMMDDEAPTALINLYSSSIAAIGAIVLAISTSGFSSLHQPQDIFWILAMGGVGGTAVLFLIMAYRMTEQSNLAPFSYFGIPLAFGLGWLFFDEAPWGQLFPGVILVVFSGLLIIWREQHLQAQSRD